MANIDTILQSARRLRAENTNYIMYVANLHMGDHNNYPIVVQLWDGKNSIASLELCKTFDTKEEAEAYIAEIYEKYPAPPGRENGPIIVYAGDSGIDEPPPNFEDEENNT